jgi:hypothetical protein
MLYEGHKKVQEKHKRVHEGTYEKRCDLHKHILHNPASSMLNPESEIKVVNIHTTCLNKDTCNIPIQCLWHSMFLEQTRSISLNSTNRFVFAMKRQPVFCAVRNKSLYITRIADLRQCDGSAGYSPASGCEGPGSIPGQSTSDLW